MVSYKQLHQDINNIFSNKQKSIEEIIEDTEQFIDKNYDHMNCIFMASIMNKFGKRSKLTKNKRINADKLIDIVADVVHDTIDTINGRSIGNIFYGLQRVDDSKVVYELIDVINDAKIIQTIQDFKGQEVANAIYGLQNTKGAQAVYNFLEQITCKIEAINDFNGQSIGNMLYGLQNIQGNNIVYSFLEQITHKLKDIQDFNGQEVANTLYGLRNLKGNKITYDLLEEITNKIKHINDFTEQSIANALYGLQNMKGHRIVYNLLEQFTTKIQNIDGFNGQSIGNALYGLQNLQEHTTIDNLLEQFIPKIQNIYNFKGQEIGNALYGLQNMKGNKVVHSFLEKMTHKIEPIQDFKGQEIGNALYGLQNLEGAIAVYKLLEQFAPKIKNIYSFKGQEIANALYGITLLNSNHIKDCVNSLLEHYKNINDFEHLGQILFSLYNKQNIIAQENLTDIVDKITHHTPKSIEYLLDYQMIHAYDINISTQTKQQYEKLIQEHTFTNPYEEQITHILIQQYNITTTPGYYIGGFELDLFDEKNNINIELDGSSHHLPLQKYHDHIRDTYLKKQGIQVHRLDITSKSQEQICQEIYKYFSC